MNNTKPRIWIMAFVTAGWLLLAVRFGTKQDWSFVALSIVAALFYGYRLYSMLQSQQK